jgi:hypothetical protein
VGAQLAELCEGMLLDAVMTGRRTGPRTLRWVYLQSCGSSPATAGTTSCASRYSPAEQKPPGAGARTVVCLP